MAIAQEAETEPRTGQVRFDGFISYSHTADELLAPRLQGALQTFAKPWWKRRALRVFRDQSSLSANPHLWSSITAALDASDWFILLTSPEAAASAWVDREVAYWRAQKDPERIIPVLTDGTLAWDETSGRLDPNSAVPPSLLDAFNGEPRWVDLRWAEEETQLDLRNGRFREAVADIASSLRGSPRTTSNPKRFASTAAPAAQPGVRGSPWRFSRSPPSPGRSSRLISGNRPKPNGNWPRRKPCGRSRRSRWPVPGNWPPRQSTCWTTTPN